MTRATNPVSQIVLLTLLDGSRVQRRAKQNALENAGEHTRLSGATLKPSTCMIQVWLRDGTRKRAASGSPDEPPPTKRKRSKSTCA